MQNAVVAHCAKDQTYPTEWHDVIPLDIGRAADRTRSVVTRRRFGLVRRLYDDWESAQW